VVARRAAGLLRFNPAAFVIGELLRLGFDAAARQLAEEQARRGLSDAATPAPIHMPFAGGLSLDGWEDVTPNLQAVTPSADYHGMAWRWFEVASWPAYDPAWGDGPEVTLPLVAPEWADPSLGINYGLTAISMIDDPFWPPNTAKAVSWQLVLLEKGATLEMLEDGVLELGPAARAFPRPKSWPQAGAVNRNENRRQAVPFGRVASNYAPAPTTRSASDARAARHEGDWAPFPASQTDENLGGKTVNFGPKARERKIRLPGWKKWMVVRLLETAAEASDALGAIYNALPAELRKATRQQWVEGEFDKGVLRPARELPDQYKLLAIAQHWRLLDAEGVVRELLWETLEDKYYGHVGTAAIRAQGRMGHESRHTTAPDPYLGQPTDNQHPLQPRIPDGIEEWVTGRKAREARQTETVGRSIAIAEATRRRQARGAEIARRQAYRDNQRRLRTK
jgi:hypothetical protein